MKHIYIGLLTLSALYLSSHIEAGKVAPKVNTMSAFEAAIHLLKPKHDLETQELRDKQFFERHTVQQKKSRHTARAQQARLKQTIMQNISQEQGRDHLAEVHLDEASMLNTKQQKEILNVEKALIELGKKYEAEPEKTHDMVIFLKDLEEIMDKAPPVDK